MHFFICTQGNFLLYTCYVAAFLQSLKFKCPVAIEFCLSNMLKKGLSLSRCKKWNLKQNEVKTVKEKLFNCEIWYNIFQIW